VGCESFTESPWPEIYVPEIKDVSVQTERKERVQQQQAVQQPVQPEEEEEEEEEVTQVRKTLIVHPQLLIPIRYFLASLLCICD
jgi:hypothetical protein